MNLKLATLLVLGFSATAAVAQFPESCACPDDCVCNQDSGIISCDGQGIRHVPVELNSCSWPGIHTLNLSSNFIREIQEYSFSLLTNLTRLYIYDNSIELVDRDAFVGMRSLEYLFLDGNRIASLPYQVFRPLRKLQKVLLYDNYLTTLPFGIFSQQAEMTVLALHSNRLTELKTEWFDDTPKLQDLYLHDNQISDLSRSPFRSLHKLKTLFLSENRLTRLTGSDFLGLRRLTVLVLSHNQIETINNDVFLSTPQLQRLFLEFNRLTEINRLMFAPPVYLEQLRVYSNRISRISDGAFYRLRNLRLLSLYDNQISTVTPQTFVGLDTLDELVIHNNQITDIRNNTFTQSPLLQRLWMNSNRISCLESDAFSNLRNLFLLNLGYNRLSSIPEDVFQNNPGLIYLLLNSNRLSSIANKPFRNLPKLLQLALTSNPIQFISEGSFIGTDALYYFQFSRDSEVSAFRCDCSMLWLHKWMTARPLLSSVLCGQPEQFAGQDIRSLQTASFGCEAAVLTIEVGPDCDNHVVAQGSCLQLTCSSRPRGILTWARADGQPIRTRPPSCSSSSLSSCPQYVSGDGNLVLESVTPEDAGYYICTASFLNQTAMKICRVSVAEPPVVHREPEEVYLSYPGPPARFSLNFTGDPTPSVSWYHILPSGAEIYITESGPTSRYLISDSGSLVILQTQLEDRGTYKAIISNGGGTVTTETQLYFFFTSPCRSECQNGGDCREIHQCRCPDFYEGRYCETFVGVTETIVEPPTSTVEGDRPPSTAEIPRSSTTSHYELPTVNPIIVDESGSGSGSGSDSNSESSENKDYIASGDVHIGSASGSELGLILSDKFEGDGTTLVDDEDFEELIVHGSVVHGNHRKKRSRVSVPPEQHWYVDRYYHQRDGSRLAPTAEESSRTSTYTIPNDKSDIIVSLPKSEVELERYNSNGGLDSQHDHFLVFEYSDQKDSRADMLKFER